MRKIALIPARSGSERVAKKNLQIVGGKTLVARAVVAAIDSGVFDGVFVSTNDGDIKQEAVRHGALVIMRPSEISGPESTDLEWVNHALTYFPDLVWFMIVRPTNPFRTAETLKRAAQAWEAHPFTDSMRSVSPVSEHPLKTWRVSPDGMLIPFVQVYYETLLRGEDLFQAQEWQRAHDMQTKSLPPTFVQDGCLHVAWKKTLALHGNHTGRLVKPFFSTPLEALDINTERDLMFAQMLASGK